MKELTDEQISAIKEACIEQIKRSSPWDSEKARKIGKLVLGDSLYEVIPKPAPTVRQLALKEAKNKLNDMYEQNKLSQSDIDQVFMFDYRMFEKTYAANPSDYKDFDSFEINEIMRDKGFSEVDREEYYPDSFISEVLEHLFNLEAQKC